jgi:periplasmic divalent cation tolerance protein
MGDSDVRLGLSTFADEETAKQVVRQLLGERLIACGTLIPGTRSFYLWRGEIEESGETLVLFKTADEHALPFMERLKELHPYEVPEIVLLEPEAVSTAYEVWIRESLRKPE